jgi:VanZ family protein
MKNSFIWFVPAICVAFGILLLSTVFAIPFQVEGVYGIDKIEHVLAYFVLVFSFLFAFSKTQKTSTKTILLVIALSSIYGLSLEWIQYFFFEYRVFEWKDALANFIGVISGFAIFKIIYRG